jgi:3-oxoacyl-[acyl-carrier protein] reductase
MSAWLELAHKTAVVTGAASGIGRAVAKALTAEQCNVVLADRDSDKLDQVARECGRYGTCQVSSIVCNVTSEASVQNLFRNVSSPASILINCAGMIRDGWIGRMSVEQWDQVQDVNLKGTFLCCREFLAQPGLPQLKKTPLQSTTPTSLPSASIINIASVVATQGNLGQTNYAASKGGVMSFTKALAREVAPRKIRVNCVLPGFIDTQMTEAVPENVKDGVRQKIVFQQKFGTPEDISNLILFLASCRRSGYITGEAMECSGMISL